MNSNPYQNLVTPQTVEEVRVAFTKQLEAVEKCDGEYLRGGKTLEETAVDYLEYVNENNPTESITLEDALEIIESKVKEYATHKGEAQLFYLNEVVDKERSTETEKRLVLECIKIWESELSELVGVPYMPPHAGTSMPRFIGHVIDKKA